MKLTKLFIMFFIFILLLVSCKKTTVTITKPAKDISLLDIFGKIEDGTYEDKDGTNGELEITDNGNSMKVGNGANETNYTKGGDIGGFVGIYTNTNDTNNNMLVIQGGGVTITMPANGDEIKAVEEAYKYLGEDKTTQYIAKALENREAGGTETIDTDKLLEGVPEEDKKELKEIFDKLPKSDFGSYKIYGKS